MYKWFQRRSAYMQFMILVCVSVLLFICFFEFWRTQTTDYYQQRNEEYIEDFEAQMQMWIQSSYSIYSRIARLVSYDKDLQDYLLTEDAAQRYTLFQGMGRRLSDVANLKGQILDIVVVDSHGNRINLSDMVYPLPKMELSDNKLHCSALQNGHIASGDVSYIVMGKSINSIDSYNQTNQRIGWLYLILTKDALTVEGEPVSSASGTRIYLIDQEEQMLWSNDVSYTQETCAQALANPEACGIFRSAELPLLPYRLILCQPEPFRLTTNMEWPTTFLFAITLFSIMLILIWGLFARNMVRPCKELARFNEEVGRRGLGGLSTGVSLHGYSEATLLGETTTKMLRQIQDLTVNLMESNQNLYESKLLKRQAELQHLRSQINPHFLYNTLETMVGIAYSEKQPELAEIARSLSLIFKYSIKGDSLVPLRDELKIAQNYLSIQRYRFQKRFGAAYDIPEDCLDDIVPKMILQPLIENSIVHGVEGQQEHFCHVTLRAEHRGDGLFLYVEDDGLGIHKDRLLELKNSLSGEAKTEETEHIGLVNVNSRIRLMYGSKYGLRIESKPGEGTRAALILPIRKKESRLDKIEVTKGDTDVSGNLGRR